MIPESDRIKLSYHTLDADAFTHALHNEEGKSHEEILEAFEAKLCQATGSPYAVALSSGTAAIHLALIALRVEKDDHVPVSTFTYVGSVNPICYVGAKPVFIDSEQTTWNMDPNLLEDCIKKLASVAKIPKAIQVVHTYGMPAQMDDLLQVAARYDIPVMEDAAAGIGASYHGKSLGTLADVGVFSFNNNKTITALGGGALLTRSKKIYERVKFLATQAREDKPYYEFKEVGYNYRMSPLNAMYGLAQLAHVEELVKTRRALHDRYRENLNGVHEISFQHEPAECYSSRWLTTLLITSQGVPHLQGVGHLPANEQINKALTDYNIESRYLWKPMHTQPVFKHFDTWGGAVSETLFANGLCLPSGNTLTTQQQDHIVTIIKNVLNKI